MFCFYFRVVTEIRQTFNFLANKFQFIVFLSKRRFRVDKDKVRIFYENRIYERVVSEIFVCIIIRI